MLVDVSENNELLKLSTKKPALVLSLPAESRTWKFFVSSSSELRDANSSSLSTLLSSWAISFIVNLLWSIFLITTSESFKVFALSLKSYSANVPLGFKGVDGLNPEVPISTLIIPSLSITSLPALGT